MVANLLYCIKDFSKSKKFGNFIFTKNKIYEIKYDETDWITPIHIIDDNKNKLKFHETSHFNKEAKDKYFIPLQQMRKLKLDKLNEIS